MCDTDNNSGDNMSISTLLKKALATFKSSSTELFQTNLEQLTSLFNRVQAKDVKLHPMFLNETSIWYESSQAPTTYIHMYNNDMISVGIFVLKPNAKLPLHNHPKMYGLLKVIGGTVRIRSYSLNTEKSLKYQKQVSNTGTILSLAAERLDDLIVDSTSKCCVLQPDVRNIHEIESINGPAAFMDILSPPYDDHEKIGDRKCSYFRELKQFETNVVELQEIKTPSWYWSDSFSYLGPKIDI